MHRFQLVAIGVIAAGAVSISAQGPIVATAAGKAAARATVRRGGVPNILPGTDESAFTLIQGNALNSTNGQLANSLVRLRDARLGRIVDTQVTDHSGLFAFRGVDPGNYVVELVGNDQTVLAASQMLSVDAGEAVSAVVRLPFRVPPFSGLLGRTAAQAATVAAAATASGVLAENVVRTPSAVTDISPR
jgi:hypothetical protein